jgi:hypothetical protein
LHDVAALRHRCQVNRLPKHLNLESC